MLTIRKIILAYYRKVKSLKSDQICAWENIGSICKSQRIKEMECNFTIFMYKGRIILSITKMINFALCEIVLFSKLKRTKCVALFFTIGPCI